MTQTSIPDSSHNIFLDTFVEIFDIVFPKRNNEIKHTKFFNFLDYTRLEKIFKEKQCLYEKFLKCKNDKNKKAYKIYRNLFEKTKIIVQKNLLSK